MSWETAVFGKASVIWTPKGGERVSLWEYQESDPDQGYGQGFVPETRAHSECEWMKGVEGSMAGADWIMVWAVGEEIREDGHWKILEIPVDHDMDFTSILSNMGRYWRVLKREAASSHLEFKRITLAALLRKW